MHRFTPSHGESTSSILVGVTSDTPESLKCGVLGGGRVVRCLAIPEAELQQLVKFARHSDVRQTEPARFSVASVALSLTKKAKPDPAARSAIFRLAARTDLPPTASPAQGASR